jgi:flagellar biosynthesis protein FlhA
VVQNLLDEAVHVRDLKTIVETLAEHGTRTQDPVELTREVRVALAPAIVQQIYGPGLGPAPELPVIAIEPGLENLLVNALAPNATTTLEPGVADFVMQSAGQAANAQEESGIAACLLVPDRIRAAMARLVKKHAPRLRVLGHSEIPEMQSIRIARLIGEMK